MSSIICIAGEASFFHDLFLVTEKTDVPIIKLTDARAAVLKRPAMYIGSTGPAGLIHLVAAALESALRAAVAGRCRRIEVVFNAGQITIRDDAPPLAGRSTASGIVRSLARIASSFPRQSIPAKPAPPPFVWSGLGLCVVNFLSDKFEILTSGESETYFARCRSGFITAAGKGPPARHWYKNQICFTPNMTLFEPPGMTLFQLLVPVLQDFATCLGGLRVSAVDAKRKARLDFHFPDGPKDRLPADGFPLYEFPDVYHLKGKNGWNQVEMAFCRTDFPACRSYANLASTHGGSHVRGMTRALADLNRNRALVDALQTCGVQLPHPDKLRACLSALVAKPQYEGGGRQNLYSPEIEELAYDIVSTQLVPRLLALRWKFRGYPGWIESVESEGGNVHLRWLSAKLSKAFECWPPRLFTGVTPVLVSLRLQCSATPSPDENVTPRLNQNPHCTFARATVEITSADTRRKSPKQLRDMLADKVGTAVTQCLDLLRRTDLAEHVPTLQKDARKALAKFRRMNPKLPAALAPYAKR